MSETENEKKISAAPRVHEDASSCAEGHVGDIEGGSSIRELHRTFTSRHIQMICLGGCIGSGIFISTGKA
ncbi:hypothetical protein NKR23_g12043 [Pleurostoma richardsiae]|uniref:Amino acid permease/ SLC12A domain-containing protein n=1 Tax=Pleurostoma richardsiae TaxID=41990 RepID=A0AA38R918_9PEZI|nr:hypothetical protein NKR23_g12043 [Pleurostoma richardsiae]